MLLTFCHHRSVRRFILAVSAMLIAVSLSFFQYVELQRTRRRPVGRLSPSLLMATAQSNKACTVLACDAKTGWSCEIFGGLCTAIKDGGESCP
jgi:hypothetical protein